MLTISLMASREYYLEWSQLGYYMASPALRGAWLGYIAHQLGLLGVVNPTPYERLLDGFSPDGKRAFVRNAGKEHTPGWDLTFSAPKSVSILQVFDEHGLIQHAHEAAVMAALRYLETHAAFTRRGEGGQTLERLPGLLAAMFTHFESRSEDMQLHSHVLVFNVAERHDLTWGTIHSRTLYQWKMAAGAAYRAELAQQLRQLGYTIEADNDSFHVVGVPKDICEYYSKRAEQIEQNLAEIGASTSASAHGQYAKLKDRQEKANTPLPELTQRWQAELTALGFDKQLAEDIRLEHPTYSLRFIEPQRALDALTETQSTFRKQDIHQHIALQAQVTGNDIASIQRYAAQCLASEQVIELGLDHKQNQLFTTKAVLEAEHQMITLATQLSQQDHPAPSHEVIQQALADKQAASGYALSDEQVEALMCACNDKQLAILQGSAGAGKSASMEALRLAYEATGQRVAGAAVPKKDADNLQAEAGINSQTLARILTQAEQGRQPLSNIDVLVIDEAGLIGTKQMQALLQLAVEQETKVVLVGEDKQLESIEHSGVLKYLSRPDIIGTSRIETIRRQRQAWARQAVMDLRDGKAQQALEAINAHQLVNFADSHEAATTKLVSAWQAYTDKHPDKAAVVLAQRWSEVELLSKQLRKIAQQREQVGLQNIELECIVSNKAMTLPFSTNERVRFAKNDYSLNVSNGTLGTVKALRKVNQHWQLVVTLDDGRGVTVSTEHYKDEHGRLPLVHAYAMTVYSSQGITVDGDTFVLYNANMDRANSYVAGSRHKDNCHWFVNNKEVDTLCATEGTTLSDKERLEALATLMSREQSSGLAIEYLTTEELFNYIKEPTHDLNDYKSCSISQSFTFEPQLA
ncbi:MobF family relaxase [Alteromonas stellipolaris]|uniref:MobF family relaxase n=1 Tax=Alteromonas stellipolaris TaxID=233316 RepID=UPI00273445A6|nr:MobF family relaxase [Alteromonas stellipolaris]MDP2596390.1 MobF family relaxase [Alteromonas stellipolaris]